MSEKKEPIYMKWWLWVSIFIITAFIVNYTTDDAVEQVDNPAEAGAVIAEEDEMEEEPVLDEETMQVMVAAHLNDETAEEDLAVDDGAPATFAVGDALPAGEYFVFTRDDGFGYVLLTRRRDLTPGELIWQRHFENHTMIYIRDGEYLTTKNATLIPIDDAIVPNFEDGVLQAGTYRVGVDIPPGVYTLFPVADKVGFFSTASTSHQLNAPTTAQRNFSEPITISLNTGDYFTMLRAEIRK